MLRKTHGKFTCESNTSMTFQGRLLADVQAVIMTETRRRESFTSTWKDDMSTGGGRTTVYIHPHVFLIFKYSGGRTPSLTPAWLHALNYTTNSGRGLDINPEARANTPLGRLPNR